MLVSANLPTDKVKPALSPYLMVVTCYCDVAF